MKLLFAFDIDGTLTHDHVGAPDEVLHCLESLYREGHEIIFLTGRTFAWTYPTIQNITFPYTMGVQNGAVLIHMPEKKTVFKRLLNTSILPPLQEICQDEATDVVVYSGYDHGDICYYRPKFFDPELLEYTLSRAKKIHEKWVAVESFDELPFSEFASTKCFGYQDSVERISTKAEKALPIKMPMTFDAVNKDMRIAQGSHKESDKGRALLDYQSLISDKKYFTIACGDDYNDVPMLQQADVKVVMETAPDSVKAMADVLAPSAEHLGIIQGIKEALKIYDSKH